VAQGNDYLIAVKGNQPKLMQLFQTACAELVPHDQTVTWDTSRGRVVQRTTQVFAAPPTLVLLWSGAKSLVVVHRQGTRPEGSFQTQSFYLSSLKLSAVEAEAGIRQHRDIENGWHWVRDVVLREDAAPFTQSSCALNWSIVRSIALNLFRAHGYPSLTSAIRRLGHDLLRLLSLLTSDSFSSPAAVS
jgi:predicted transposase YbfD/YdcC